MGMETYSRLIILILQSMLCSICILEEQIHGNFFFFILRKLTNVWKLLKKVLRFKFQSYLLILILSINYMFCCLFSSSIMWRIENLNKYLFIAVQ